VRILELRHVECEPPAAYLPVLAEHAEVVTVRPWCEPLPEHHRFAAIIAMGGPMGVNDRGSLPWIDDEIAYLREATAAGVPVWGVCLGAQLLAAALGAAVYSGPVPEVGITEVELTAAGADDPVWGDIVCGGTAPRLETMQWHGDTFDVPPGAELLASSPLYPNQLFRHGGSYGIQFHVEADAALARQWLDIPAYRESLHQALGQQGARRFLDELAAAEQAMTAAAERAVSRWMSLHVLAPSS
jgi:GMP synthase-like glutamine amidotransferase